VAAPPPATAERSGRAARRALAHSPCLNPAPPSHPPPQGAGYLALGETLTPLQLAGAGVTLGAVYLINTRSAK
jgi:hypothetical protein